MKRLTKFLSMALAVVIAVSAFSFSSYAKMTTEEALTHSRALTEEEVQCLYFLFEADQYAAMYPDVAEALGTDEMALFTHFITFGVWEERLPSVAFSVDVYATWNPALQVAYGDDIISYYVYYVQNYKTEAAKTLPTVMNAFRGGWDIYSVYDFVKGQVGPREGATTVQDRTYYPGMSTN